MRALLYLRGALAALFFSPLVLGMAMTRTQFECENAVAHLQSCCAGFTPTDPLCPHDFSCADSPRIELSLDESECIKELECSAIRAGTMCDRARALAALPPDSYEIVPAFSYSSDAGVDASISAGVDAGPTRSAVCP